LRKKVGMIAAACFYYSGLVSIARWLMQCRGQRLIILNYHRATGGDLRRHLLYLRRHYRMLHLEEALDELYAPGKEKKQGDNRRTPLVLTFDDGYHDNYTHAYKLARELHVPITIFLAPGYVESGDSFWWLEGNRLVRRAQVDEVTIEGHCYDLRSTEGRRLLAQAIDSRLRHAKSVVERVAFLTMARELLAMSSSVALEEGDRPMTWGEVRKMQKSGWVSFGAHTMHHPILAYLADPAEVQYEVGECRRVLAQQLGHSVRTFAYPVGRSEHISDQAVQAVQKAGYEWAVTTIYGVNTAQSDPYRLRRVLGDVSRHWLVMAAETSGIWKFFSPLWQSLVGKGVGA